jgi:hypothetical protein
MSLGRHVYLDSSNAEELLPDIIEGIKNKTYNDSRRQAFDDCTLYWKEEVIKILKECSTNCEIG